MFLLNLLIPVAIFWLILYYIVGYEALPDFRLLVTSIVFLNLLNTVLRYYLGYYAFIPNVIILAFGITIIHKLDFKQVLKSTIIFLILNLFIKWTLTK